MATSTDTQHAVTTAQSSPIIASLREHVSYTEVVFDPLWQGAMLWNLLHCIRLTGETWYLRHLATVMLAINGSTRLDPNLMCPLKDIRLDLFLKNAFLNGDLNEEVYMKSPPSVAHQSGEVYKLQKALYELKQAPRACVGRNLFFSYVDDMIIIGDDCDGIELLEAELSHQFVMKELGLLRYFCGIEVASSPKSHLLSQSMYIANLYDRARMTNNKIADISLVAKAT
uniref:Reverse transcriptase Ty1/copia-type domain-containing protein n=1 Tax=Tanacetum cinerariifolium TaxID=118510 RepID=A0A699ILA5_TANCI|nr:hypothetical protein [Tanacetum cinerariifolium]